MLQQHIYYEVRSTVKVCLCETFQKLALFSELTKLIEKRPEELLITLEEDFSELEDEVQEGSGLLFNWMEILMGKNESQYGGQSSSVYPNDPEFGKQWSLPLIGAPEAWSMWTGVSHHPPHHLNWTKLTPSIINCLKPFFHHLVTFVKSILCDFE